MDDDHTVGALMLLRDGTLERRATVGEDGRVSIDDVVVPVKAITPGIVRVGEGSGRTAWVAAAGDLRWVFLDGEVYELEAAREGTRPRAGAGHGSLSSPMPATVVRVEVSAGAHVRRGDTLVIVEAMKMELPIRAASDGVVTAVHCQPGELVQPGVSLVEME